MNANPAVSLVFVNYRSARYLQAALESLFSFEKETDFFEVIVINNDPSESAVLQAMKKEHPFFLRENVENIGFGQGSNLGAWQARGKTLGFINPDVLWTGAHLRRVVDFFRENIQVGVLGMMLLDESGNLENWSFGKEPALLELFLNNGLPRKRVSRLRQNFFSLDWVSGGALFIRKELFMEIGGFDKRFFLYFEDVDLCKEVRKRGFSVACHAKFPLIHLGGKSHASERVQKKHFSLSQREYYHKHRPKWEGMVLEWLQFVFRKI